MSDGNKRNQDNFSQNRGTHGAEQYVKVDRRHRRVPGEKEHLHVSNYSDGGHGQVEGAEDDRLSDEEEEELERFRPHDIEDDRYNQSDCFAQDRYNEIPQDRFERDHTIQLTNRDPNRNFQYHYGTDDLEERIRQDRRRGRHYREY
ncbi:hypothetical protein [Bdellovibrio reynosensis]|uniref:Uncharacterized protein n=1 Tax=Bdellovibrio reynosensis TaxID=2835041 RepID=A0ABY4CDQ6_9BACT|nr:hypothetical protein [Bdellovibrio reynosensis]UOF02859.1 hypothetical protein MNR06_07820 [Bdellovibrio reynosensis]